MTCISMMTEILTIKGLKLQLLTVKATLSHTMALIHPILRIIKVALYQLFAIKLVKQNTLPLLSNLMRQAGASSACR